MELLFLGRGSAFNPKEGNTSAYFIENNQLFLIDCGESVFERLIKSHVLEGIESINIMITHTHSDHIGSIGTLAMYSFYKLNKPIHIILPNNAKHLPNIDGILKFFGCDESMYTFIDEKQFDKKYSTFENIRYIETKHKENIACYSILFKTENGIVYYSGDTKEIDIVKSLIQNKEPIDKLYIDTTTDNYKGNVHLNIKLIEDSIPEELKSHVYCMHINNDDCIQEAQKIGFNVVTLKKSR